CAPREARSALRAARSTEHEARSGETAGRLATTQASCSVLRASCSERSEGGEPLPSPQLALVKTLRAPAPAPAPQRVAKPRDAQPAVPPPWRALLIGCLLIPPSALFGLYGYLIVQAIHWTQTALLRGPVFLLFLLVAVNAGLRRLGRRWPSACRYADPGAHP